MSQPLVSVVIPTFNRAHCLPRAIESVLSQTRPNVEVIVIDDGSTDGTVELFRGRYATEKRVRYVPQSNGGVTAARNRGLALVKGDFVGLLDSDDVWKPWKLEVQLACMEKHPEIGMVWTDMEAVDANGSVTNPAYLKTMYTCYSQFTMTEIFSQVSPLAEILPNAGAKITPGKLFAGDVYAKMFMGSLVHTSTVLIRRERFEKVKAFNEDLKIAGEDYDFHLRTCEHGPVGFVNLSSIEYQIGMGDQLSNGKNEVHGARNALRTITDAMQRNPGRINLPKMQIRHRFADVHSWVGEAMLDAGQRSGARKHLRKSLLIRPWHSRTARLFALSMLPEKTGASARAAFRHARRILKPARTKAAPSCS